MEFRTVRDLKIACPGDEPDDLDPARRVPAARTTISEVLVAGEVWKRAEITGVTISRSWFVDADLSSARFDGGTLDRCILRRCNLIGAHLDGVTLRDVVFENCRLDYAYFTDVKAAGPVAIIGCSMTDTILTAGKLSTVAFDGCKLAGTTFDGTDLRGADLRGNDITKLTAGTALRGAILSPAQIPSLTDLLLAELAIQVKAEHR
ncbi:uncharacterized protein YjbI with pentapeptide repeats [Allocatelliglobosispora scoriae]|uniref:Uncharacterized protein YjbI with pentapeptide repeats n=1 Tax=Allocatelliglobosispora scoriae TaxID=643052 RepID=A0A841BVM3_9ACTN|nr:pentapeptide repeat-containing protein [Allocatelliglobosispora scoriae]MBB5871725.1 uncharacterized protein YjbI with pentapeptide repeats [Allocatelliglobosispora scoriae]